MLFNFDCFILHKFIFFDKVQQLKEKIEAWYPLKGRKLLLTKNN